MKRLIQIICFCSLWLFAQGAGTTFSPPNTNGPSSRVVVVENQKATEHFVAQLDEIPGMIERGLLRLTGKKDTRSAWQSLVTTNDVVGIKVFSTPGKTVGTRPEVVEALIRGMVSAGIRSDHIIIWDKKMTDLYFAGFRELSTRLNVKLESASNAGWSETEFYENAILGTPVWGDLEFEKKGENVGRKSHVSKLLTSQVTKIICVSPLLNHNSVGVTGHLYSLALGSVDNSVRFDGSAERLSTAVPDLFRLPELSEHVVLCVTDALICQYQGERDALLHYSTPLNQLWLSSDPVAADVLAINELDRQRKRFGSPEQKLDTELYKNATLLELGTCDLHKISVERLQ